jgi:nucleoside-diphosphate-sugar epimerase
MAKRTRTTVGVTGAGGYLGGAVASLLREKGYDVVEYRRNASEDDNGSPVRGLQLDAPIGPDVFEGLHSLVLAAWDLSETNGAKSWERNVEGSKRIVSAARAAGVSRIVFVSSMSAYYGTHQNYGLMKLAVERAVLEIGGVVVRPGLVYGGTPGGMTLTLSRLARLPVIPVFRGANLFTAHVDDVVGAVATLAADREVASAVVGLANPVPVPFKEIMRALGDAVGSSAKTIDIPWRPLLLLLQTLEKVGVPLPVRSDSLLGLVRPASDVPGLDVAASLGLAFRPFPDGLDESFEVS